MSKQTIPPPRPADATPTARFQPGRNRRKATGGRVQATFEGKRDNSPVLFGRGRSLSAAQKTRLQRRLYLGFAGVILAAIVGVATFGWLNFNVIQPNQPILTVNGHAVPQKMYRFMVAYLAQDTWNQLQAAQQQILTDNAAIAKDPKQQATLSAQIATLNVSISSYQTAFSQTNLDQQAVQDLTEDQIIQEGIAAYQKSDPAHTAGLTVTSAQIDAAYVKFGKAFPAGQSLSNFLSQNSLGASDVKATIAVILRRNAMDTYQQSLVKSPTVQYHAERIQYDNQTNALKDLAKIQKGGDWNAIAKADSIDVNTRDNGGDLGWFAVGQQDQVIEDWVQTHKAGDMSGVLKDVAGTFEIVKLLAVDPSRPLDAATLSTLKSNALSHWLTDRKFYAHISPTNQDMYNSAYNIPTAPNLTVTFPATPTPAIPVGA